MATSLLALLDDIATVLDDVTVMTKAAAGRTAGVLGDDLALNAEQVSGVRASRELPVVWAVFRGSAKNKLILVPSALLLAAFAPFLIQTLLIIGGLYLCFEGFEKVAERYLHPDEDKATGEQIREGLLDPDFDFVTFEKEKIKGAIRTDFVLSAEIIVIAMGTVQEAAYLTQVLTIVTIAVLMTFGVYGLVAAIVKLDDLGLHLAQTGNAVKQWVGNRLLDFAPFLMKTLTILGTAAMFLVGGGILVHGIPPIHHTAEVAIAAAGNVAVAGPMLAILTSLLLNGITGIIAGGLAVPGVNLIKRSIKKGA